MTPLFQLKKDLKNLADSKRAIVSARFFKTGKGEYGEGDKFLGITVPEQRIVANKYLDLKLFDIQKLLDDKIHEHRLVGLLILVGQFNRADEIEKKKIYNFYIKNAKAVNNWDLVDLSAPNIIGQYLLNKNKDILYKLAQSKNLWEKRISIVSTYAFIRQNDLKDVIKISEILLKDPHDLIHKAVGWMLRETGKRDLQVLIKFLDKFCTQMPRTMLRYSIEKFPEKKRQSYLKKVR